MNFLTKLTTVISIPAASFTPAAILSVAKNTELKWAIPTYPEISFDVSSNEYMQARPKSDYRLYNFVKQGGKNYDIAFGALENTGDWIKEINMAITSIPFKINIKGKLSSQQSETLFKGGEVLLKDVDNSCVTNRKEILKSFYRTCSDEGHIKDEYDWYVNPQNHMGTQQGDWNYHNYGCCGNPTNMWDFDAGGQWLDNGGIWKDRCQGLLRSDKGCDGPFKCWLWDTREQYYFGTWSSANNALNSETKALWSQDFLYKRNGQWKANKDHKQSEQAYNYVNDEIINDTKNLNINKWTSWDDTGCPQMLSFYFVFKNFFDCIKITMNHEKIPGKKINYTLNFKYDSSLLNGKSPFSFYILMLGPRDGLDARERHEIYCFHPTANDFGGLATDHCHGWQRGQMCGIFDSYKYNNTTVNPSVYTWNQSGSIDIKNPLIEE